MKTSFWKFLFQWQNIHYLVAFAVTLIVAILTLFSERVESRVALAAILSILSYVLGVLFVHYKKLTDLESVCLDPEGSRCMHARFSMLVDEIRERIATADEVWLLSRTGRSWVEIFKSEFDTVLKKKCRFVVIGPYANLLEMVATIVEPEWENRPEARLHPQRVMHFLRWLKKKYPRTRIKVVDYLPAWSLLLVNPQDVHKSMIYVEFATFGAGSMDRPMLRLAPSNAEFFGRFLAEYETMWKAAQPWETVEVAETNDGNGPDGTT